MNASTTPAPGALPIIVETVHERGRSLRIAGRAEDRAPSCGHCGPGTRMVRHGLFTRQVRDLPQDGRPTWLAVRVTRWRCARCGHTAMPALTGIPGRRRMTQRLMAWLVDAAATRCAAQLARETGLDEKTVREVLGTARRPAAGA